MSAPLESQHGLWWTVWPWPLWSELIRTFMSESVTSKVLKMFPGHCRHCCWGAGLWTSGVRTKWSLSRVCPQNALPVGVQDAAKGTRKKGFRGAMCFSRSLGWSWIPGLVKVSIPALHQTPMSSFSEWVSLAVSFTSPASGEEANPVPISRNHFLSNTLFLVFEKLPKLGRLRTIPSPIGGPSNLSHAGACGEHTG